MLKSIFRLAIVAVLGTVLGTYLFPEHFKNKFQTAKHTIKDVDNITLILPQKWTAATQAQIKELRQEKKDNTDDRNVIFAASRHDKYLFAIYSTTNKDNFNLASLDEISANYM